MKKVTLIYDIFNFIFTFYNPNKIDKKQQPKGFTVYSVIVSNWECIQNS